VFLLDQHGQKVGVVALSDALRDASGDTTLVQVGQMAHDNNVQIPVCRLFTGQDLLDQKRRDQQAEKERRRQASKSKEKEIRVNCTISTHDLYTKTQHALELLKKGHPVKFAVVLKRPAFPLSASSSSSMGNATALENNPVIQAIERDMCAGGAAVQQPCRPTSDNKTLQVWFGASAKLK
jgi:hypothetical protein